MTQNQFYNSFDTERLGAEKSYQDYRTPFQVDRDRIIHTSAFRRLQSKTQVFWSGQFDFYRTRLTHSLEVAQIGRSICHHLKASSQLLTDDHFIAPELVEAACLAHDIGHPPFGHTGERTLNQLMQDWGGFEGNAQTLRLITETIFDSSGRGMNPTRAFLDSTLKYKTLHRELQSEQNPNPKNHFIYTDQLHYLDFVTGDNDFPHDATPGPARDSLKSIECQIMDWADDTAYSLNDIADGVQCGFLNIERIERWAEKQPELSPQNLQSIETLLQAIRNADVERHLGRKIGDYIQATSLKASSSFLGHHSHRYAYQLEIQPEALAESKLFKSLAYQVIFLSPTLKQLEHKAHHMLVQLFETFSDNYIHSSSNSRQNFNLLPEAKHQQVKSCKEQPTRARFICDYLASLTDHQATRLYQRLFSPASGSIIDLMA